jgi:bacterioferritin-associated ferredoxin
MIVCHCTATNDTAVREAIAAGADEVDEVTDACGAGSDCGGCHRTIERLLSQFGLSAEPVAA